MTPSENSVKTQDPFDKLDIFDIVDAPKLKAYEAPPRMALELTAEIRDLIKSEIAKLAPQKPDTIHTREVIREKMIAPPERVIVKEVDMAALEKAVEERLKARMLDYEKNWKNIAPIVVPNPVRSPHAYGPMNVTITRNFDATLTSLDEIANVLGSLIKSLKEVGILQ